MVNQFLKQYEPGKDFSFPSVSYRVGAAVSTKFDIFIKENWQPRKPYFHYAIDRGGGRIVAPFDHTAKWVENVSGYGSLLYMRPLGADFSIRVAHIEHLSQSYIDSIKGGGVCMRGAFVAFAGQKGCKRKDGIANHHTHTEIVSNGERSAILESIIEKSGVEEKDLWNQRLSQAESAGLGEAFEVYCKERHLISFTNLRCQRYDNQTGKPVTYYSSSLFNI